MYQYLINILSTIHRCITKIELKHHEKSFLIQGPCKCKQFEWTQEKVNQPQVDIDNRFQKGFMWCEFGSEKVFEMSCKKAREIQVLKSSQKLSHSFDNLALLIKQIMSKNAQGNTM